MAFAVFNEPLPLLFILETRHFCYILLLPLTTCLHLIVVLLDILKLYIFVFELSYFHCYIIDPRFIEIRDLRLIRLRCWQLKAFVSIS